MEKSFDNWMDAVQFLADQSNAVIAGVLTLKARQDVDMQVIAALLADHPDKETAAERWRQMASESLPAAHLSGLQCDLPEPARNAAAERVAFWEKVFRAALGNSEP